MPSDSGPVCELTSSIARWYRLSFIGWSSGSLKPEERPYPWVSFSPACLRERPDQFLLLLARLGEWNAQFPRAQWVYRPEKPRDQTQFCAYCLLEPLERNDQRSEGVLVLLRQEMLRLAGYLLQAAQSMDGEENLLSRYYARFD